MIVSIDSLSKAIVRYIGNDLAPSYPFGTPERITVGVFAKLLNNHPERLKRMIVSNPFVLTMVSDDGENVDIEELAGAFTEIMNGDKFRVTFPVIGQVGLMPQILQKLKNMLSILLIDSRYKDR